MSNGNSIIIKIPQDKILPKEIYNFTLEENYQMLLSGIDYVLQNTNTNINYISKIETLEKEIEKLKTEKLEQYKDILETTTEKLNHLFSSSSTATEKENLLVSKEDTSSKVPFRNLMVQTFRDFNQFHIQELNASGGGDFKLKFPDFSVLVDTRTYINNVNCRAREKIKHELINSDCFFGWLVSMETNIDKFDKSNFMFEWLSENKCICYINALSSHTDPIELLRSIYFTCQTIYNITNVDATEITELHKLKENENRIREISQKIIQNAMERDEMIQHMKDNFQKNDEMIRQILNKETNELVDRRFSRILDWWNFHIVNEEGSTMRSSNIWTMFKRDNPDLVGEIQPNDFKDMIYTFISEDRIIKPRNKFGALEIKNIRWKVDRPLH